MNAYAGMAFVVGLIVSAAVWVPLYLKDHDYQKGMMEARANAFAELLQTSIIYYWMTPEGQVAVKFRRPDGSDVVYICPPGAEPHVVRTVDGDFTCPVLDISGIR